MIEITSTGSFKKTETSIRRMTNLQIYGKLRKYAEEGRRALSNATPEDTSRTADSWKANVIRKGNVWEIVWSNTNVEDGVPVVILLQYGHATGTGGYVRGTDFINPAIKPIFDKISQSIWEEVKSA